MKQYKMKQIQFKIILVIIVLILLIISVVLAISTTINCSGFCINREHYCKNNNSLSEDSCEIGCCVDKQRFEHNNYPKGMCILQGGKFYKGNCKNFFIYK